MATASRDAISAAWYVTVGRKVSVIAPPAPAGTTKPCCHPSRRTGVSGWPFSAAAQPGLKFSWTSR